MKTKLRFIISMLIFGSIGIFVKFIDLPSASIVLWRTTIASLCLYIYFHITKQPINWQSIKQNAKPLIISGASIGSSWVFLFLAYQNTSVGMATIIYYFAPVIVFFISPFIFKEKATKLQMVGITFAIFGMVLVNVLELLQSNFSVAIIYAFISAVLYAVIMITNKFLKNIDGVQSTFVQLMVAALVIAIYCFVFCKGSAILPQSQDIIFILIIGIVHTSIAMSLYIPALRHLSSQNISIFSYIDPASALIFAFIFLKESLSWYQILGAILIFGGALFAQIKNN